VTLCEINAAISRLQGPFKEGDLLELETLAACPQYRYFVLEMPEGELMWHIAVALFAAGSQAECLDLRYRNCESVSDST